MEATSTGTHTKAITTCGDDNWPGLVLELELGDNLDALVFSHSSSTGRFWNRLLANPEG